MRIRGFCVLLGVGARFSESTVTGSIFHQSVRRITTKVPLELTLKDTPFRQRLSSFSSAVLSGLTRSLSPLRWTIKLRPVKSSIVSSVLATTASVLRRLTSANNLASNLIHGFGRTSTLDTASTGAGCCFFLSLRAGTMSIGLSGKPFDACDQVKNERNAFTLDLSVGLLITYIFL